MIRVVAVLAASGWLILTTSAYAQETDTKKETEPEPIVYTNADLPPPLPTTGTSPPPAPASTSSAATTSAQLSYDSYLDKNGHGEGWWRHRAAELDLEVLAARLRAQELHVGYVKGTTIIDPTLAPRSREATLLLLKLEAEREGLTEELRQAGGLPGWLRRDGFFLPSEPLPSPAPEKPIRADGLKLSWKPVARAAFYIIEVQCLDCCGLLGPCEVRTLNVTRTSARFPFEADRSGRWRVRALDAAGFGGVWSTWYDFEPSTD